MTQSITKECYGKFTSTMKDECNTCSIRLDCYKVSNENTKSTRYVCAVTVDICEMCG